MSLLLYPDCALNSDRLTLEPLDRSHASALFHGFSSPKLYQWIPNQPPVSKGALEERYGRRTSRRSPNGEQLWLNWACRRDVDGEYIGLAEVTVLPDKTAWLAYFVFSDFQRQGFATEFCESVLRYLYDIYQLSSVTLFVDTRNQPSICLAEKLGFVKMETIVDADFFDGVSSDEYRYEHVNPASV